MKNICKRTLCAALALGMALLPAGATNWGLWYGNGLHQPPNGEDTVQTLAKYGAYYMGSADEKTLYLTFDCGYENGNTAKILDTLKKQHVPGAFFVVGDYLKTAPALVKRMGDEGHLVCNHTYNHPNMSKVGRERFAEELTSVSTQYKQLTGRRLAPFYRPPEGAYSYDNLAWAQSLGWHTTLWSVAYADWDPANQPSYASAKQTIRSRTHNGAIILLHAVSSTNAAILNDLISGWKAEGYTFKALSALPGLKNPTVSALPNDAAFAVNGTPAAFTAFLIDGANYIKLRDAAAALSGTEKTFSVAYDAADDSVQLTRGGAYEALGTELSGVRNAAVVQAGSGSQRITLDGETLSLKTYLIDDANYVKLRDLAQAIDCGVGYDNATRAVTLNPAESYAAD